MYAWNRLSEQQTPRVLGSSILDSPFHAKGLLGAELIQKFCVDCGCKICPTSMRCHLCENKFRVKDCWNVEQEIFLRNNILKYSLKQLCSLRLFENKSASAIQNKYLRLGIKKWNCKKWTKEEDVFLRKNYVNMPIKEILEKPLFSGRTTHQIEDRASKLNLKRKWGYGKPYTAAKGYRMIPNRHDCPYANKYGVVREHRLVWWLKHPDDLIKENELIHHINENRLDNRIENLQKLTVSEHIKIHRKFNKKHERVEKK